MRVMSAGEGLQLSGAPRRCHYLQLFSFHVVFTVLREEEFTARQVDRLRPRRAPGRSERQRRVGLGDSASTRPRHRSQPDCQRPLGRVFQAYESDTECIGDQTAAIEPGPSAPYPRE